MNVSDAILPVACYANSKMRIALCRFCISGGVLDPCAAVLRGRVGTETARCVQTWGIVLSAASRRLPTGRPHGSRDFRGRGSAPTHRW